jgi:rhodanese-related sulfurtransferase
MKAVKTLHKIAVFALASMLISVGAVHANTPVFQPDSDYLARWQATYDGLLKMKPKWGKQGAEAFKTSVDAGVPILYLDVRTPKEWQEGVIENALLINLNTLPTPENLARLPKDRDTIIGIYCKAGHRSTLALALLHQLGYKNAINMSGGMQAWRKAGYPVVKHN